jgi:hypothetical protein
MTRVSAWARKARKKAQEVRAPTPAPWPAGAVPAAGCRNLSYSVVSGSERRQTKARALHWLPPPCCWRARFRSVERRRTLRGEGCSGLVLPPSHARQGLGRQRRRGAPITERCRNLSQLVICCRISCGNHAKRSFKSHVDCRIMSLPEGLHLSCEARAPPADALRRGNGRRSGFICGVQWWPGRYPLPLEGSTPSPAPGRLRRPCRSACRSAGSSGGRAGSPRPWRVRLPHPLHRSWSSQARRVTVGDRKDLPSCLSTPLLRRRCRACSAAWRGLARLRARACALTGA